MSQFGFVGPSYVSTSAIADAEECINFYPEAIEGQGKTALALYPSPGLRPVSKLVNETEIWGQKWVPSNGRYFVAGSHLYELDVNFTITDRGALTAPTGPIKMICNQTQLLICSDGDLWVFKFSDNSLTPLDGVGGDPASPFPGAVATIGFSDGFAVAVQSSPADIALSAIGDFTSWNAINTSSISLFPDNIVSMIVDHRQLVLFGNTKYVVYVNAGAAIFPFQPAPGSYGEQGADSLSGPVQLDNSVMWITFDDRGNGVAYRSQGYGAIRISNHAVEQQWQSYAETSDLISYSFQMNGHPWWHLYFPTANVSWRYDVATGMWHKALGWKNGVWTAHNTQNHAFAFGKHLVGDWASGTIYQMAMPSYNGASWDFCSDGANPIRRLRRAPYVQTEAARMYHNRIDFDLETGLGPMPPLLDGAGKPRDPQMNLRWSDDGTKTWSNNHTLDCGQAGKYKTRAYKTLLGSTLHGRVYEVSMTDPIPWRFANAYLDADPGFKPGQRLADQLKARGLMPLVTGIPIKLPSDLTHPIVDEKGVMTEDFSRYLMQLSNTFTLITADTTAASITQPLPLAAGLPNQEIFAIKISSDGHTFTLSAQGSDKINKQGAWGASTLAVGTAQGAAARLKSDGNSNWYVI